MTKVTRNQITFALAQSMREFGYPDVTDEMAGEILDAYVAKEKIPHDVVGMFLERQLEELEAHGVDLAKFSEADQ